MQAAVRVVQEMGYVSPEDHIEDDGLPLLHFALLHARQELPPVELHWRIHWYEKSFAHDRLLPSMPKASQTWRASPADEFVALLLFYARDGFIDLRVAADISAWWESFGLSIPQGALDEIVADYPQLAHVICAALKVAERVVGIPNENIIQCAPALTWRDRAAVRLATPNPRASRSQLYANSGLIDGLLSPAGGLRAFIYRQVLPPREVLIEQARHAARPHTRSRLGRCLGVLTRYALASRQLVRSPETLK